jgi:phosphoribosyl-ATP pyrophosphohydrolase
MDTLEILFSVLQERKNTPTEKSYVASLYAKGTPKIIAKVIEESVEMSVEALNDNKEKLKQESADLLFHMMVLWAHMGITLKDVTDVLEQRAGVSGHDEKAGR